MCILFPFFGKLAIYLEPQIGRCRYGRSFRTLLLIDRKYLDDNQSTAVFAVFFLVMLRNPDVMRRAQAEIDAVVGRDRLPTLDDLDRLPYIYATIHELLRWWPVAPLSKHLFILSQRSSAELNNPGLPHSIMEVCLLM